MRGFTFTSVIVLVVVVAVVGIAAVLLARTVQEAQTINAKAQNIAVNGRGINTATDSIIQLRRTNKMAQSILESARPLDTRLGRIVATAKGIDVRAASINGNAQSINSTARSINGSAVSINDSAGSINESAGTINESAGQINQTAGAINTSAGRILSSAGAINTSAGRILSSAGSINASARSIERLADSILGTARDIDEDVRLINTNLNVSLRLASTIKGDTGNILTQAEDANQTAACVDNKLEGPAQNDGDCRGGQDPAPPSESDLEEGQNLLEQLLSPRTNERSELAQKRVKQRRQRQRRLTDLPELPELPQLRDLPQLRELPDTQKQLDDLVNGALPLVGEAPGRVGRQLRDDLTRRLVPGLNQR